MYKIKAIIISFVAILGVVSLPTLALADATSSCSSPVDCIGSGSNSVGGDSNTVDLKTQIKTIVNILLFILGAIAVIMIIIGGIRYTTSNGDSSAITSAKNTILYAVVGLVVAILAFAIVNFVVGAFKTS